MVIAALADIETILYDVAATLACILLLYIIIHFVAHTIKWILILLIASALVGFLSYNNNRQADTDYTEPTAHNYLNIYELPTLTERGDSTT